MSGCLLLGFVVALAMLGVIGLTVAAAVRQERRRKGKHTETL